MLALLKTGAYVCVLMSFVALCLLKSDVNSAEIQKSESDAKQTTEKREEDHEYSPGKPLNQWKENGEENLCQPQAPHGQEPGHQHEDCVQHSPNSLTCEGDLPEEQCNHQEHHKNKQPVKRTEEHIFEETVFLAVAACGDRLEEALVMLKSAVLLAHKPLHCFIFTEKEQQPKFRERLDQWPRDVKQRLQYDLLTPAFPEGNYQEWKDLFKPCAAQKLFLPDVLKDVEKVLLVDSDILFLRPVDDMWAFFEQFNSTQIASLTPEHEQMSISWYARFARQPFYPPFGMNSGVMLMHLERMRKWKWVDHILEYHRQYKGKITWPDQDLINVFFHFYPEGLYVCPCQWNYRADHCMYMTQCRPAEEQGISILHGNRDVYHNDKQPIFKAVYESIKNHDFEDDLTELPEQIQTNIQKLNKKDVKYPGCFDVQDSFTKQLIIQIQKKRK